MKILINIFYLMALLTAFKCSSNNEEDLDPADEECRDNTATLSGAVSTIINNNCAVAGCHVAGTDRVNFTLKSNIIQHAEQIRVNTQTNFMPPAAAGITLNAQQKADINCWVKKGALDN